MIYAEIDGENICYAISDMGKIEVTNPKLIPLDFFDTSVIGKKYNNGVWEDGPQLEPKPTQLDEIQETQLTIMEASAEQYEQQLEKDLNNMEVQATIYEAILSLSEGGKTV